MSVKFTRTSFPTSHKLLNWYPGLPKELKNKTILYSQSLGGYYDSTTKTVMPLTVPIEELKESVFWQSFTSNLIPEYARDLRADIFYNVDLDEHKIHTISSVIFYDFNGQRKQFIRKGQRLKITYTNANAPIIAFFEGKYVLKSQQYDTGMNVALLFRTLLGTTITVDSDQPRIESDEIITITQEGCCITETSKDKKYYVVDPTGAGGRKVNGPFETRQYTDDKFLKYKTFDAALSKVIDIFPYLTLTDVSEATKEMMINNDKSLSQVLEQKAKANYNKLYGR